MSAPGPEVSPALFFDTVNAYQQTAAIKAAIDLDLFTAIAEGGESAHQIAERCGASQRGTRILCDYLTVLGFLTKQGDRYSLTADSAFFLSRRSPAFIGGSVEFLLSPMLTAGFKDLASAVRKGGTVMSEEGTVSAENPIWVEFARSMAGLQAMPAQLLARFLTGDSMRKLKVLDIAAGHGLFGISMAQQNPHAEITALDWPNVLEVAKENAVRAQVIDRYHLLAGSAFDVEYGSGYDLVLITNFLHHFDRQTCELFLKKVHRSLAEGGRAVTLEFVPNEDRVSPPEAAKFSMVMLGSTPQGDAYTFSEMEGMFANAGFKRSELQGLTVGLNQVVISYK
jgi:2-polyprenyl-3-methyl-5-hydroxy-6-metoxy-1,4-benzoquinol methylase